MKQHLVDHVTGFRAMALFEQTHRHQAKPDVLLMIIIWLAVIQTLFGTTSGQTNLALNKPTSQNSLFENFYASLAVDGRLNQNLYASPGTCSHTYGKVAASHWWMVDLQGTYTIKSLRITNRVDCCEWKLTGFTVEVSQEDPKDLAGFPNVTDAPDCIYVADVVPNESLGFPYRCDQPVTGRFVRVVKPDAAKRPLTLCEFEVYEEEIYMPPENLATGKPTSASSQRIQANRPSKAVDANADGHFRREACFLNADYGSLPHWWMVDLQKTSTIRSVRISTRTDCCWDRLVDFMIEVSLEHPRMLPGFPGRTSAAICATVPFAVPPQCPGFPIACDEPVTGRYVRLIKAGQPIALCEIEISEDEVHDVFAKPDGPNLALGKRASQSTTDSIGEASNAVDGSQSAYSESCIQTKEGSFHWWMLDLEDNYMIDSIGILSRYDTFNQDGKEIRVEVSITEPSALNGFPQRTNARVCRTVIDPRPITCTKYYNCTKPEVGRFVRVVKDGKPLNFCEFQVFGRKVKINGENGRWQLMEVGRKGPRRSHNSLSAQSFALTCARQALKDTTKWEEFLYVQVDTQSGACHLLRDIKDAGMKLVPNWVIYEVSLST